MNCRKCGEHVLSGSRFCPSCGSSTTSSGSSSYSSSSYPTQQMGTDSMCVGSAIAGVIALLFPLLGITGGIAIACGAAGRKKAQETGMGGKGLATLGIVLGILSLLRVLLAFALLATPRR